MLGHILPLYAAASYVKPTSEQIVYIYNRSQGRREAYYRENQKELDVSYNCNNFKFIGVIVVLCMHPILDFEVVYRIVQNFGWVNFWRIDMQ